MNAKSTFKESAAIEWAAAQSRRTTMQRSRTSAGGWSAQEEEAKEHNADAVSSRAQCDIQRLAQWMARSRPEIAESDDDDGVFAGAEWEYEEKPLGSEVLTEQVQESKM